VTTKEELWKARPGSGVCDGLNSKVEAHEAVYMTTIDEDYGSLESGGSYEKLQCPTCGSTAWSQMAD
jgi:hypothetical protein